MQRWKRHTRWYLVLSQKLLYYHAWSNFLSCEYIFRRRSTRLVSLLIREPWEYRLPGDHLISFSKLLRHRRPSWEEKLEIECSNIYLIVVFRCCNYYFHMFHGECCMKHGVHVSAEIFVSESYLRVKRFNYFFAYIYIRCCGCLISMLQLSVQWEKFPSDAQTLANPYNII